MPRTLHFISGLPRSGSTLLAGILRQNPRFHAAMSSPVAGLVNGALEQMGAGSESHAFFDEARRKA
ncbi:sulfotransferase, partial [Delftia tsuruhatensis]